jgi:hypothetical protein
MQPNLQAQSLIEKSISTPLMITSPTSAVQTCSGNEIMVDQSANITISGIISSEHTNGFGLSTITADDFTVATDVVLTGAQIMGFAFPLGTFIHPSVDLIIFRDDNGQPGAEIYKENYTTDAAGNGIGDAFMLYIPTEVKLTAGKYWLGVHVKGPIRWNWYQNSSTHGSIPHLINFGGGFGFGTDWVDFTTAGLSTGGMNFVLDFCPFIAKTPIPTMSEWGLVIFGLLIINVGVFFVVKSVSILS